MLVKMSSQEAVKALSVLQHPWNTTTSKLGVLSSPPVGPCTGSIVKSIVAKEGTKMAKLMSATQYLHSLCKGAIVGQIS